MLWVEAAHGGSRSPLTVASAPTYLGYVYRLGEMAVSPRIKSVPICAAGGHRSSRYPFAEAIGLISLP